MEDANLETPLLLGAECQSVDSAYDSAAHSEVYITISEEPIHTKLLVTSHKKDGDVAEEPTDGDDVVASPQMQQAISMFENLPSLERPSSVDPFKNKTPVISGLYEWLKTLLCLPVLVLRLILMTLVMLVGLVGTKAALAGWRKQQAALPRWRRSLMGVTRLCARGVLFCFGFHWIKRTGRPARREIAPIVVSNHVCFMDPIFYFFELFPSIVSSNSHESIPLVGTVIQAMQVIPVDRLSPDSRKNAAIEIIRKASCHDFPPVLLFPEGTTTNGRALISFKLGAFVPGLPVQPVVIRYPFVHFDPSWGDISLMNLLFRMLTQVHNFMEVEYLPVMYPSLREQSNPPEFAERVRFEMAKVLNVPETEHTHGDLMLSVKAQQLKMSAAAAMMVEMGRVEKLLQLSTKEVKEYLDKFAAMDPTHSGKVSMEQFMESCDLQNCWFSKKIFHLFDKSTPGSINFQEFVAVSASISKHKDFAKHVRSAFDACDLGKNGYMSHQELEHCLRLSMPTISSHKVKQWSSKLDSYGGKGISWESFAVFLEHNPELLAIFMVATFHQSSQPPLSP
ncbi:hypothetical protein CY35_18G062200 [Sphagnum magellanicum]|nr:hypothetical protein CY35_18G062200 [Sphagnum magellanicum]